jgi:hypothetical protein
MDETRQSAKDKGYVETVFGRRLYLPEINSPNGPRRSGAERAAINAPMQGTAADLIKLSMAVQQVLDSERRGTKMIMQVHDELVFEVPDGGSRLAENRDPAPDGRRGRTEGAAAGRSGCGAELGQGALRRWSSVNSLRRIKQSLCKPADSSCVMGTSPSHPDCSALVIMASTLLPVDVLKV